MGDPERLRVFHTPRPPRLRVRHPVHRFQTGTKGSFALALSPAAPQT
jgi:hypothetical protein